MQTSECFQVDPDLFSCVGPRLCCTLHVGPDNGSPGQCAAKIDVITGPKFSLLWCIFPQYVLSKPDESNRPKYLKVGTFYSVWPIDGYNRRLFVLFRLLETKVSHLLCPAPTCPSHPIVPWEEMDGLRFASCLLLLQQIYTS